MITLYLDTEDTLTQLIRQWLELDPEWTIIYSDTLSYPCHVLVSVEYPISALTLEVIPSLSLQEITAQPLSVFFAPQDL